MNHATILHDDFFGDVRFDEARRTCDAITELSPGQQIEVSIDATGIEPAEALQKSRHIYIAVAHRAQDYGRSIASKLLPLYNRSWRDGDPLDAPAFVQRISLQSISIAPFELGKQGCATLYYNDGGLFAGHLIEVFLDANFAFSNAQLAG